MDNITLYVTSEQWDSFPPAAQKALFFALQESVKRLETRVAELEARLEQNSGNSNKPPSTDLVKRHKKEKTGKPKGGRPGHKPAFAPSPARSVSTRWSATSPPAVTAADTSFPKKPRWASRAGTR